MSIGGSSKYCDYINIKMVFDNISDLLSNNPKFVDILKTALVSILQEEYSETITCMNNTNSNISIAIQLIEKSQKLDASALKAVKTSVSGHCKALDFNQFSPNFTHNYASTTTVDIQPARIIIQTIRKSMPQKNKPNEDFVRTTTLYFNEKRLAVVEETVTPLPNSTTSPSKTISYYDSNGNPINDNNIHQTDHVSR